MRWDPQEFARTAPRPILLIGADGMLGRAWRELLRATGVPPVLSSLHPPESTDAPAAHARIDLTDDATTDQVASGPWRAIINCAAWTDVDGAESREADAAEVNARGVARLAQGCRRSGALLVHYSTDYVFSGDATSPYATDVPRAPVGAYGRTKAAGEEAVEASGCEHLIVRTSWLYAPWGKNFVRTIAGAARQKPALKVVNDQRGRPTSAEHLARLTAALLAAGARGVHHGADGGECTWFDFAREIVRLTGAPCDVAPCTTAEFPRPAKRPAYSVLDLSKTEALIGPMSEWRDNLADVVRRLEP